MIPGSGGVFTGGCMICLVVVALFGADFIMLIVLVRLCIGATCVALFVGVVCYYVLVLIFVLCYCVSVGCVYVVWSVGCVCSALCGFDWFCDLGCWLVVVC